MRIRDIDQAIAAIGEIYSPHALRVARARGGIDAVLNVVPGPQPVINLSYGAPVEIDCGNCDRLFLVVHAGRGNGSAQQNAGRSMLRSGQTLVLSANAETRLALDSDFAHTAVRLDPAMLGDACERWLGHPLMRPFRFDLTPFSVDLERAWQHVLSLLSSTGSDAMSQTGMSRKLLDDYLLTLLIENHPHNHRAEMQKAEGSGLPGIVRQAERLIRERAQAPVTVVELAAALGVGVRTLQVAFRTWRSTTPRAFLRQVRLDRVRDTLLHGDGQSSVTDVALDAGFTHLGRFSGIYRRVYGECPHVTRRRTRHRRIADD